MHAAHGPIFGTSHFLHHRGALFSSPPPTASLIPHRLKKDVTHFDAPHQSQRMRPVVIQAGLAPERALLYRARVGQCSPVVSFCSPSAPHLAVHGHGHVGEHPSPPSAVSRACIRSACPASFPCAPRRSIDAFALTRACNAIGGSHRRRAPLIGALEVASQVSGFWLLSVARGAAGGPLRIVEACPSGATLPSGRPTAARRERALARERVAKMGSTEKYELVGVPRSRHVAQAGRGFWGCL